MFNDGDLPLLGFAAVFWGAGLLFNKQPNKEDMDAPTWPSLFPNRASPCLISLEAFRADSLSSYIASSLSNSTWIA